MPPTRRLFLLATLPAALLIGRAAPAPAAAPTEPAAPALHYEGPIVAGTLAAPPRNEASGLAASRRSDRVLWTHDDSGGASSLFAVGTDGEILREVDIKKTKNVDWEDVASVELDGRAWLVIADTGDNDAKRKSVALHFLEEPSPEALRQNGKAAASVVATFRLTFPDGPRDCESVAVDARERAVYLLTKRDLVPRLYRLPLPARLASADVVVEFVAEVPALARSSGTHALATLLHKGFARPCGMDFAPDGSAAVVIMMSEAVVFPRQAGETWADAFARAPLRLTAHELPQAEAVCFSHDGKSIYVASESTRKLLRYDRR